jgi:hypothetical protein
MGNVPVDDVKYGMKEICYQDEVCDVVQGGVQDDVRVQDEARSEFQGDDSMNAEPNDSMSVAELSQSSSANTLSSGKTRKESANNLSASFKNIRYKTIFNVKTVSEGQFTLAKGSPVSGEKLEKYYLDKNTQKAANNVKQKVKSINQKKTHNFRGAKAKVNLMSTPTKRKEGGSVQSLLCVFEHAVITKPSRTEYGESPAKRRRGVPGS